MDRTRRRLSFKAMVPRICAVLLLGYAALWTLASGCGGDTAPKIKTSDGQDVTPKKRDSS